MCIIFLMKVLNWITVWGSKFKLIPFPLLFIIYILVDSERHNMQRALEYLNRKERRKQRQAGRQAKDSWAETLSRSCSYYDMGLFDLWFERLAVWTWSLPRKNPICISKGITFQLYFLRRLKSSQVLPSPNTNISPVRFLLRTGEVEEHVTPLDKTRSYTDSWKCLDFEKYLMWKKIRRDIGMENSFAGFLFSFLLRWD